jgi:hypothetical protein
VLFELVIEILVRKSALAPVILDDSVALLGRKVRMAIRRLSFFMAKSCKSNECHATLAGWSPAPGRAGRRRR